MSKRNYVFATGISRSGTTALCELINAHPRACIGVERYKYRLLKEGVFTADFFTRDRFFDFDPADTNVLPAASQTWRRIYDAMRDRFDDAIVVGDKIPDAEGKLDKVVNALADVRIVWMVREPARVAASWQARADDPRDKWPPARGFMASAPHWRRHYGHLEALLRSDVWARRILAVDYDGLFSGSPGHLERLRSALGLEKDGMMDAKHALQVEKYMTTIRSRDIPGLSARSDELTSVIGPGLIERVMKLSSAH